MEMRKPFSGPEIFKNMPWEHEKNWDEVRFKPLLLYLRGNSSLALPKEWKAVFPTCI